MKSIKFIFAAFVAVFMILGMTNSYAQEDNNRDANGYVVRGPYLTNGGGSNWFVGVGGGVTTSFGEGVVPFSAFNLKNNWSAEAFVGKWFTPSIGFRVGYKGVMDNFGYDTELYKSNVFESGQQFFFGYGHGDVLWNLSNALGGYKETRFWDIIPHVGGGIFVIKNDVVDHKFALDAGLYNEFRLGKVVNLYLDLDLIATENAVGLRYVDTDEPVVTTETPVYKRPTFIPTATAGITFNLGKRTNFDRLSSVWPKTYETELNDANRRIDELTKAREEDAQAHAKQLADALNRPKDTVVVNVRVDVPAPVTLDFAIGEARLSTGEKAELYRYIDEISESEENATYVVTGCADKGTGSYKRNKQLSQKRADYVKNLMVLYGVSEKNIQVEVAEPGTLFDKDELNRVVVVD